MSNSTLKTNVTVKSRYICLEDNSQSLELEIHSDGCINTIIMSRSDVYNISDKLYNYGAIIPTVKDFKAEIIKQEKYAPVKYVHSNLGWDEYNGKRIFKGYSTVGCEYESTYNGAFDIKPKGSFEKWRAIIRKYALSQTALQLSVVMGLTPVTIGFLQNKVENTLLAHIAGESSSGKTTFGLLALSTSSNPNPSAKNTMFCDWGDTPNYLTSVLEENYGYPVVFDELSKSQSKDLSDFVYNITNSKGKGRLNSSAEAKPVSSWKTIVISTGENSLLSQCNHNSGLLVRVLELSPDEITANAEQAEKLKNGIIKNYGWANSILAEFYLQNPKRISNVFNKYRQILEDEIPIKNLLVNRLIKKLAAIMTTAYFAKRALDIKFNTQAIKNMLIEAVVRQNEDNPFEQTKQLVDCILTDLSIHPNKYFDLKSTEPLDDIYGNNIRGFVRKIKPVSIGTEKCSVELIFPTETFSKLLFEFGFTNSRKELKALDKEGFLKKEGSHYSVRRKIAGNKIPVYVLTLPESLLSNNIKNTITEE